jgi:hypothetical protein
MYARHLVARLDGNTLKPHVLRGVNPNLYQIWVTFVHGILLPHRQ